MAEEQDLGKTLMTIGILLFMAPIWLDMVGALWFLFIVGLAIAFVGIVIKSSQSGESLVRTSAV